MISYAQSTSPHHDTKTLETTPTFAHDARNSLNSSFHLLLHNFFGGELSQARAVGCGFILTEARGAVGRIFEDLNSGGGEDNVSRSFREALIDPWISTHSHQRDDESIHGDEQPIAPTPPMVHSAPHETGASRPLRPRHDSTNARESVVSGLVSSSSKYVLQHGAPGGGGAAASATPGRYAQFHVSLQALHVFWQEHGHLPVLLNRDQADEIVRIADELVETGKKVSHDD